MSTKVQGADRLASTLDAAGRSLAGPGMRAAVAEVARVMTRNVRARTPRRTGALAASVRPGRSPGLSAVVESGLSYGPAHEYGVPPRAGRRGPHNIRAARMFEQGLAASRGPAIEATSAAVRGIMSRVKGV